MGRKRPERKGSKISKLIFEEYQPETAAELQEALKDVLSNALEEMLKAELDDHLGYEYGESPLNANTRNGFSKKPSNHLKENLTLMFLEIERESLNHLY